MERVFPLAEAASGNDTHTRGLQQPVTVVFICTHPFFLGGLYGLCGQIDGGEEIHAPLWLWTFDTLHLGEGFVESRGAFLESGEDAVVFVFVEVVGRLAGLGRVDHEFDETLSDDGGAETDADEFVYLLHDFGVESTDFKVTSAMSTFANHAFGYTVERGEFDIVVCFGRLGLELAEDLLEGVELSFEDVGLVYLICNDYELLLGGEFDYFFNVLGWEACTGWVTRINDDDCADIGSFFDGGRV